MVWLSSTKRFVFDLADVDLDKVATWHMGVGIKLETMINDLVFCPMLWLSSTKRYVFDLAHVEPRSSISDGMGRKLETKKFN